MDEFEEEEEVEKEDNTEQDKKDVQNEDTVARKFFNDPLELANNDDLCQAIGFNLVVDSRRSWKTSKRWICNYGSKPKPRNWYKRQASKEKLFSWYKGYKVEPGYDVSVDPGRFK